MIEYRRRAIAGGRMAAIALLALVVPLTLAACGGSTSATDTPKPVPTVAPTTAPTIAPTTAPTAAVAATTAPTAVPTTVPTTVPTIAAATSAPQGTTAAGSAVAASGTQQPVGTPANATLPPPDGIPMSKDDIKKFVAFFNDQPLIGGQMPPRFSKFVNKETFIFLQFDKSNPDEATSLRYIGMGMRGVFCAEAQPDAAKGAFTHFHRYTAPTYAEGHGGPPGAQGYWLSFVSVDSFDSNTGKVTPGPDYKFSPTPPPSCGANVPKVDFTPAGAKDLSKEEIAKMYDLFSDKPLTGGQTPPRISKFANKDVFFFLQFDKSTAADSTQLRYIGIGQRGQFCSAKQPTTDFTHFHRYSSPTYAEGHGGPPDARGYWLQFNAVTEIESNTGKVTWGPDRKFSPTPPPPCP
jgi:hypothetical protein